jgi:monoamine oxidase
MPAASSHLSRKRNNEGKGNLSSPSSACASGSKKKMVDSPGASKKTAVITSAAAAPAPVPAPVVAPAPSPAPAAAHAPVPVSAPRKKADIFAEDLDATGIPVDLDNESEESEESDEESKEESEEEPEEKEEEEPEKEEEKEKELAVQGGIAHDKVD